MVIEKAAELGPPLCRGGLLSLGERFEDEVKCRRKREWRADAGKEVGYEGR